MVCSNIKCRINHQLYILSVSVPSASPENVKVQLLNVTSAQVLWHSPPRRDLHGDLKGYKVSMVDMCTQYEL